MTYEQEKFLDAVKKINKPNHMWNYLWNAIYGNSERSISDPSYRKISFESLIVAIRKDPECKLFIDSCDEILTPDQIEYLKLL